MSTDVCILVEGTYPYVSGGVSSWLHALLKSLPDISFEIVYLEAVPAGERTPKYELPENVVGLHHVAMHDGARVARAGRPSSCPSELWGILSTFHHESAGGERPDVAPFLGALTGSTADPPTTRDLLHSRPGWELLVERYRARARETSFIDFFWTFRSTHVPLFSLLSAELPPARLYHTLSTGYAGFLGALAKTRRGSPLMITEHGVYNREREIEIAQANWIYRMPESTYQAARRLGFFKEWWIAMFKFMAWVTYASSDEIVSITNFNQRYQLRDGAHPDRMTIIPNGVDIETFCALRERRQPQPDRFVVGLVGRVVPIKDIKTFVLAIKIAAASIPGLVAYCVGPTDEDEQYFSECRELAEMLGVTDVIEFTGRADVREFYPMMDVMVLTSLSEGQPLVILEANCVGVPIVSTNVGACEELLLGGSPEDQALGPCGILTRIASPQETAQALIELWRDEELRNRMADAGYERVRRFYRKDDVYDAYRELYSRYLPEREPVTGAAV